MHRKLIVVFAFLVFALMPFGASAQTSQALWVKLNGQASLSQYFYTSDACSTNSDDVTYLSYGGPRFTAKGISPTSGKAYEKFNAVGNTAWGDAYFYNNVSTNAFQFWFEGALTCQSSSYGVVSGMWTDGYKYSKDPSTGQLLCTQLSGRGKVTVSVDFASRTTTTVISGWYRSLGTQPCSQ